jgi:hypothetical protein
LKTCQSCKQLKPVSEFHKNKKKRDGLATQCKACKKQTQASWYKHNKAKHKAKVASRKAVAVEAAREYVFAYLRTHHCVLCAESDPVVLQFDHIDRANKSAEISKMVCDGLSTTTIQEEINKCRVLCANCHARHTAKQRNYWIYTKVRDCSSVGRAVDS